MIERGAIYTAIEKGVLPSKPRPVRVVQNDAVNAFYTTVTTCFLSATLSGQSTFRILVTPSVANGLKAPSEVQVDRTFTYQRDSLDEYVGRLESEDMRRVEAAIKLWLDL